ncbi:carbamoyltransferase [Micromonospora sp. KC606]|uniref:carbamoyltransferase family protein n=1 Tax=Micromonospora sp. KC606 TaxID=2530379 RepID=UPI00104F521A|nr:carbamoyltransferase C-terminal domain-containing protein [Micromonospora sp. KC606]TDC85050.1 carbamoyltransferase [Micromonospora sp. KC606]
MRVIGISGMHDGLAFKRRELPGLDPRAYRIVQGLDSAAALVTDEGVVAAAAEERFTGVKTTGAFPVNAVEYCLREAGLTMSDVDLVAHGFDYRPSPAHELNQFTRRRYQQVYAPDVHRALLARHWADVDWGRRFVTVPHHLAHAASSYHLSGMDDALIVVADGMGETESMTVATGRGRDVEVLRQVPALHSLGSLYGAATLYLGFEFAMDEYKVMGLAPYGDPHRYFDEIMRLIRLGPDGSYTVPALAENRSWLEHESHAGTIRRLTELLGPPREPGDALEQRHMDVAAAVQAGVEAALLHVLRHFRTVTGQRNLCLAGGVALNCTANGLISRSRMFDRIFVQPAAGDDGSALGAALYAHVSRAEVDVRGPMTMPYWGPGYAPEELAGALAGRPDCRSRRYGTEAELARDVAQMIANRKVVAWFQGRMEFGPRALGNRSILADPRDPTMRDHLNAIVKQREGFRPFAPVVREVDADRFFDLPDGAHQRHAHMLFVGHTRTEYRAALPAVTHVDGTARVQVLRRGHNDALWQLLEEFGARTGVPVLLNTSLNLRGQPIIRDPETALSTFLGSRIDRLVLGRHVVSRVEEDGHDGAGAPVDQDTAAPV